MLKSEKLKEIAERFATPVYVYDEGQIRQRFRHFKSAFDKHGGAKVCYAYKANSNLAICEILRQEGAGADVLSEGELKTALEVGVKPEDMILTSTGKTDDEIRLAVENNVVINVDSPYELDVINELAGGLKRRAKISVRINPSVDPKTHPKIATGIKASKFGIHVEGGLALRAYKKAKSLENLEIVGLHVHIGSQILETSPFVEAAKKAVEFAKELQKEGIKLRFIDMGGGMGIPYKGEACIGPEEYADAICPEIKKLGYGVELWLEPGRYIVGPAGVLVTRVLGVKETPYKNFINVDCGFTTLVRPAMYDAYHEVEVMDKQYPKKTYDVAGNLCESGDILARDRKLPAAERGDLLAIKDAGAYGFAMASNYNSRLRPPEILVRENGKVEVIRERETMEDLYGGQKVPEGL